MTEFIKPIFQGFASGVSEGKLFDQDLIIQDILNHINTRKGERVMDPEYGSIIWDLIFELKSDLVLDEIEKDLRTIIESEPRVELSHLEIIEQEHGYVANIVLFFNELDTTEELQLEFNKQIVNNSEAT